MIPLRQENIEASPLESIRHEYQNILSLTIQPDTIQTFYDDAINQLVAVNEKLVALYKKENPSDTQEGASLEDAAALHFQVTPVNQVLDAISERRRDMDDLESRIQEVLSLSPEVFVPPEADEKYRVLPGSGKGLEEKKLIPRLMTLVYILEHDLGLHIGKDEDVDEYAQVALVRGEVVDGMMRATPYYRVSIEPYNRTIYICDEEGNMSFVFDTERIEEVIPNIEDLDQTSKKEYKDIIEARPGVGMVVRYGANWRERMLEAITNTFEVSPSVGQAKQKVVRPRSDFESKKDVPKRKEGWESANSLVVICKTNAKAIENFAKMFESEHREWLEMQKTGGGKVVEHYHPNLVTKIIEHFAEIPQKRDGWQSVKSLIKIYKASRESVIRFAYTLREMHPEWFEIQKPGGRATEHYHPDLVAKINEYLTSVPHKKEGWENASAISGGESIKSNSSTIKKYAETFRTLHPEWFEQQKTRTIITEHYHPDLVAKINEYLTSVPHKKEGWESANSLMKVVKSNHTTIKKLVNTFRSLHPEWFEMQRTGGRVTEHYHPDLISLVEKYFTEIPYKKEGWESANGLRKICKSTRVTVKKYADTCRDLHPEWFEVQKTGVNIVEHYHPDLVAKIIEHFPTREK